jgi:thiol-disulfide isomerase/thioredoxin
MIGWQGGLASATREERSMPEIEETIFAPEPVGGQWLQGGPVSLSALRGKGVALIDFWDYTCVNCIRTLPYVVQWHRRYANDGLMIIGVHAPEFNFARQPEFVRQAIKDFQIEYPVVLDNDYVIWRAYSNRFWPAKYLVDGSGRIRYYHYGEGGYRETEAVIQRLLSDLNPSLRLPPPMDPVRDSDRPGAVCHRVTPELYLGHQRGQFGNAQGVAPGYPHEYHDAGVRMEGIIYLDGKWTVGEESSQAVGENASIAIRYTAKEVNLVMAPSEDGPVRVDLTLDSGQQAGHDSRVDNGRTIIDVDRPRMYNLVANDEVRSGGIKLTARNRGLNAYAFTFTSCALN